MDQRLAQDREDFRRLLDLAADYGARYLERIDSLPAATAYAPALAEPLPDAGLGGEEALRQFARRYGDAMPASNGPRFWGLVTGGTTPASRRE